MKNRSVPLLLISLALCTGGFLPAQEKSLEELLDLQMADLLNLRVVSALKAPETINKVPATVRVITADEIRENGYFTLEEALAGLPGFQFRNIQGFNSYAFMQGRPRPEQQDPRPGGRNPGQRTEFRRLLRRRAVQPDQRGPDRGRLRPGVRPLRHQRRFRHHQHLHPGSQERPGRPRRHPGRQLPHAPGRFPLRPLRQESRTSDSASPPWSSKATRRTSGERPGTPIGPTAMENFENDAAVDAPGPVQGFQRGLPVSGQGCLLCDHPARDRGERPGSGQRPRGQLAYPVSEHLGGLRLRPEKDLVLPLHGLLPEHHGPGRHDPHHRAADGGFAGPAVPLLSPQPSGRKRNPIPLDARAPAGVFPSASSWSRSIWRKRFPSPQSGAADARPPVPADRPC